MNKNGRYWMFAFDNPEGGMSDFRFSFNNIEEFEEKSLNMINKYTHYQVLDNRTNFHVDGDFGTITKWVCKNIGDEYYEETI
jgi:hypothetical protein